MFDLKENAAKFKKLESVKKNIRKNLIGIDNIVDEVIDLVSSWYMLPDISSSPQIINLWGTTGVGKTDIVKNIAKELKVPLIEIDMGSFNERHDFSDLFYTSYAEFNNQPCIILLDEVQNARTIQGISTRERPHLRGMWKLLADGSIQMDRFIESKRRLLTSVKELVPPDKIKDLKEQTGKYYQTINLDEHSDVFEDYMMESVSFFSGLSFEQINRTFREDFNKAKNRLIKHIEECNISSEFNFKNSLIFVVGNLDELFSYSRSTNPDIDIDTLYNNTKDLSTPEVKEILSGYFKPEQISRLGNNHVIFPFPSSNDYMKIIKQKVSNSLKQYDQKTGLTFKPDNSIYQLVYDEGVYPTQGVRPIVSTVKGLVESLCHKFVYELIKDGSNSKSKVVNISYDKENNKTLFNYNKYNYSFDTPLKISKLRKPKIDDKHVLVAVHEAGHALCHILETGLIPARVTAFTANPDAEGFVQLYIEKDNTIFSKQQVFGSLVAMLGGYAAEKTFFGEDNITTGSHGDLKMASEHASKYINSYCFNGDTVFSVVESDNNEMLPRRNQEEEWQVRSLLKEVQDRACDLVNGNRKFIIELAYEMLHKEYLTSDDVKRVLSNNGLCAKIHLSYLDKFKKIMNDSDTKLKL